MSKLSTIVVLLLSVVSAVLTQSEDNPIDENEKNVHVLNTDNFDDFVNEHEFVVVFFYAPWCGHCVRMKPFYHEAARLLDEDDEYKADKPIHLAKVDATVEQSLASRFEIDGYPTLKILRKSVAYDYEGPRQPAAEIAKYLIKQASNEWKPPVSMVNVLTESNFTQWVEDQEIALVEFYSPNCIHCKRLAPHFEKAAQHLAQDPRPIRLAKVDASIETALSEKYNIRGYPTLFIFRRGRHYDYKGNRETHDIIDFMLKSRSSQSIEITTFTKFISNVLKPTETYILGLFNDKQDELFTAYNDFASIYPDDFHMFHSFETNEFVKHLKLVKKVPSIVVYYHDLAVCHNEPRYRVFDQSDATMKEIEEFVMKQSLPLVGHLSEKNKKLIYENVRPLCYVFYDVDAELKSHIVYIRDKVAHIASKHKKIQFVIANETEHAGLIKDFNLEESNAETNVVCINEKGRRFIFDEDMDGFDEQEVSEFISKFEKGKLKPFIRSQKPPKDNDKRLVKVAVGSTFEKLVHDKTKNVVVAFMTPKSDDFEALYTDLAKTFKKSEKSLLFVKFDFTQNDYPEYYVPRKAPILFFAGIGKKNVPVVYNKNESFDELVAFVYENLRSNDQVTTTKSKEDL